jgi:hypothetical protein
VASRGRSPGRYVLAAAVALWFAVSIGFVAMLAIEYVSVRFSACEFYDSTNGTPHWQSFPPGSYCTVSKAQAALVPGVTLPDWHPPSERRGTAVVILAVTGVLLATVIVVRRREHRPVDAIPVEVSP